MKTTELMDIKSNICSLFTIYAVTLYIITFTREKFEKLFPSNKVKTPLGNVNIGANQFEKLAKHKNEGRDSLLYAMYRTLHDPVIIIKEKRNEGEAFLYLASFKKDKSKIQVVISVVVSIRSTLVSISTHKKDLQNILNKIKKTDDILYYRNTIGNKPGITG